MFEIAQNSNGRLWIMPCPDADDLDAQVLRYQQQGADHLVSMLACDEAALLGLTEERARSKAHQIAFHHHPIADFGLPDIAAFDALTQQITGWLTAGQGVAVHCRAGIGRSGMVTSGVLILLGLTAAQAMDKVTSARGVSIPDTVEQGRFIHQFSARHTGNLPSNS